MTNLLVVDDDVEVLREIESALEDISELRMARTGSDALRLAVQQRPDLMLLDLQLDDTDGLTLVNRMRGDERVRAVPIIFLSSERDPAPRARALDLDAVDWLTKPIDRERLRARVLAALRRATLHDHGDDEEGSSPSAANVLAVDDDPVALQAVVAALPSDRFNVRSATNMADALVLARQSVPEVVLVDVVMPGASGFELAARMMTLPELAETPIIFITQHGALDVEIRALDMGAFDFVGKPFVPEILRARVGNAVRMRRRSMRALERSEARWRRVSGEQLTAIVAQAREPLIVLDARGRTLLANDAARALVGEGAAWNVSEPMPGGLQQALPAPLLNGEQALARNVSLPRDGQPPQVFDVSSAVVATDDGNLVALTFHDQTLRLQTEALTQDRIRLEAEARTRQLMTSYLMHEIGNPLNGVIGLTQLLLAANGDPLTDQQRQRLSLVAESGELLRRLMADALDLARHEAGMFSVRTEVVPVRAALDGALAWVATSARRDGIQLPPPEGDVDEQVLADPVRLRQCLDNLLGNACKYGRAQGRVSVQVLAGPQFTEISVCDEGPGLDPGQIERLFVPFDRLGAQLRPGHGLGLALTRMLAQAMGGRLDVASEPGQGSRFTLVLPTAPGHGQEP